MQMLAKVRQELATEIGQQATQLNEQILLEQRRANDKERQILDLGERLRVAQESAQRSALDAERALQAAKQQGLMDSETGEDGADRCEGRDCHPGWSSCRMGACIYRPIYPRGV